MIVRIRDIPTTSSGFCWYTCQPQLPSAPRYPLKIGNLFTRARVYVSLLPYCPREPSASSSWTFYAFIYTHAVGIVNYTARERVSGSDTYIPSRRGKEKEKELLFSLFFLHLDVSIIKQGRKTDGTRRRAHDDYMWFARGAMMENRWIEPLLLPFTTINLYLNYYTYYLYIYCVYVAIILYLMVCYLSIYIYLYLCIMYQKSRSE